MSEANAGPAQGEKRPPPRGRLMEYALLASLILLVNICVVSTFALPYPPPCPLDDHGRPFPASCFEPCVGPDGQERQGLPLTPIDPP